MTWRRFQPFSAEICGFESVGIKIQALVQSPTIIAELIAAGRARDRDRGEGRIEADIEMQTKMKMKIEAQTEMELEMQTEVCLCADVRMHAHMHSFSSLVAHALFTTARPAGLSRGYKWTRACHWIP